MGEASRGRARPLGGLEKHRSCPSRSTTRRTPRYGVRASARAQPLRAVRAGAVRRRLRELPGRPRSGPRTGRSPPRATGTRSPPWEPAALRRRARPASAARSSPPEWLGAHPHGWPLPFDPVPHRARTRRGRLGRRHAAPPPHRTAPRSDMHHRIPRRARFPLRSWTRPRYSGQHTRGWIQIRLRSGTSTARCPRRGSPPSRQRCRLPPIRRAAPPRARGRPPSWRDSPRHRWRARSLGPATPMVRSCNPVESRAATLWSLGLQPRVIRAAVVGTLQPCAHRRSRV